jgi:hypothetical protein
MIDILFISRSILPRMKIQNGVQRWTSNGYIVLNLQIWIFCRISLRFIKFGLWSSFSTNFFFQKFQKGGKIQYGRLFAKIFMIIWYPNRWMKYVNFWKCHARNAVLFCLPDFKIQNGDRIQDGVKSVFIFNPNFLFWVKIKLS